MIRAQVVVTKEVEPRDLGAGEQEEDRARVEAQHGEDTRQPALGREQQARRDRQHERAGDDAVETQAREEEIRDLEGGEAREIRAALEREEAASEARDGEAQRRKHPAPCRSSHCVPTLPRRGRHGSVGAMLAPRGAQ